MGIQFFQILLIVAAVQFGPIDARAKSDLCNGIYEPGESLDMGLETMPFWIGLSATQFRHCGLPPLNYQVYFDRVIKAGVCSAESEVGKQFANANEMIAKGLRKYSDEQFVKDNFVQMDGSISYGGEKHVEGPFSKKQFCEHTEIFYQTIKNCLVDETRCEQPTEKSMRLKKIE